MFNKILRRLKLSFERYLYSIHRDKFSNDFIFSEAVKKFSNRNELYKYMHHYLEYIAPKKIRSHRRYYAKNMRGFGEDALHGMWCTIFKEFKPKVALEIGVYRGQVISLWGVLAEINKFTCEIHGISPFSSAGDEISTYLSHLDYFQDTLSSNRNFNLPDPHLLKALSTDINAIEYIKSRSWDLIYIDGNHDYEVALADYEICVSSLSDGGLLVMDDSSLYTDFSPPCFSFAGHPGPSRVVSERAMNELHFLGGVGHNNVFQKRM